MTVDLAVLATSLIPRHDAPQLAQVLDIELDEIRIRQDCSLCPSRHQPSRDRGLWLLPGAVGYSPVGSPGQRGGGPGSRDCVGIEIEA